MGSLLNCMAPRPTTYQGKKAGRWVAATKGEVPDNAFVGGRLSKENLYVIRARHGCNNKLYIGYLRSKDKAATISEGLTFKKNDYQVLCDVKARWEEIDLKTDDIPPLAIFGTMEWKCSKEIKTAEEIENIKYIGRVKRCKHYIIGTLDPKLKRIFITYNDVEEQFTSGEILIMNSKSPRKS